MTDRVLLPGAQQIAARVVAGLPRVQAGGPVRFRDRAGRVVHTMSRPVPVGTRVLLWRGRAFLHGEGMDWREAAVVVVEEYGQ